VIIVDDALHNCISSVLRPKLDAHVKVDRKRKPIGGRDISCSDYVYMLVWDEQLLRPSDSPNG